MMCSWSAHFHAQSLYLSPLAGLMAFCRMLPGVGCGSYAPVLVEAVLVMAVAVTKNQNQTMDAQQAQVKQCDTMCPLPPAMHCCRWKHNFN